VRTASKIEIFEGHTSGVKALCFDAKGKWRSALGRTAHTLRVMRLYRSGLKNLQNWTVHRDLFISEGFKLRARFDVNKFVTSPALIEKLLAEGEAENKEYQHPAPYTPPTNFGGSKYMRYPNNGLGFSPEVCAIPPWIR